MSLHVDLLRRAVLQHMPQRHGFMVPPNPKIKYRETAAAPTDTQLIQHLAGELTLAAPATANGLAGCIVYDIDGKGIDTIPALLEAARQRGLWAWGEWHEATNRGYVWLPFDQLTSAAALHQLGQEIVAAAELHPKQLRVLDQRTANNAITRLPFGRHTHTGQRGEIILQDGTSAALDHDAETALVLWASHYRENPADQVTPTAPMPTTTAPAAPKAAKIARQTQNTQLIAASAIQERWNAIHDVCAILMSKGGRRSSRTSWHCPCGQHLNGDQTPSLLIRPAKQTRYGTHIVQGYSPSCAFHDSRLVFDAFNVYRVLHGLSNDEMLQHARQELGLDGPSPTRTPPSRPIGASDHHTRRAAQKPADPTDDAGSGPSTAEILARAGEDCSLTRAARTLLMVLLRLLAGRRSARIRMGTLMIESGLARRTIQAAQRQLERTCYITIAATSNAAGGDDANRYTLCMGGGRSNHAPLNIKACKGGQPARPAAPLPVASAALAAAQGPQLAGTGRVARSDLVPSAVIPPPFHAQPTLDVSQRDEDLAQTASFDPAVYAAWAAALDDHGERVWTYSRSPRKVMQSHEFGLEELRRSQAERGPLVNRAAAPAAPAPRLMQTTITPVTQAPAVSIPGMQALRGELERLEREARRYFAQKAAAVGKQTQQRAAAVRRQLADLERSAARETGNVAVGDVGAAMAELEGEFLTGGLLVLPRGDEVTQHAVGIGAAQGVDVFAAASGAEDAGDGGADTILNVVVAPWSEDVAAAAALVGGPQRGLVKDAGDGALAPPLGAGRADGDGGGSEVDVAGLEAVDLVEAQAGAIGELGGQQGVAIEALENGGHLSLGEATPRPAAGRGELYSRNVGTRIGPPLALAQAGFELVEGGDGGAEAAAALAGALGLVDIGQPVVMADLAQLLEVGGAVGLDPRDGGDEAAGVGFEGFIGINKTIGHAPAFPLVAGLVEPGHAFERIDHLLLQRATLGHAVPPGG